MAIVNSLWKAIARMVSYEGIPLARFHLATRRSRSETALFMGVCGVSPRWRTRAVANTLAFGSFLPARNTFLGVTGRVGVRNSETTARVTIGSCRPVIRWTWWTWE